MDRNGTLDKEEVKEYIKLMSEQVLTLHDAQIDELYSIIDTDSDGAINKKEMEIFLKAMMSLQDNLSFKNSNKYFEQVNEGPRNRNPNRTKFSSKTLHRIQNNKSNTRKISNKTVTSYDMQIWASTREQQN